MFFPANLLASTEETKPIPTKANIHPQQKSTTTQIITTNQVWSIPTTWPGNGTGRNMQLPRGQHVAAGIESW